MFEIIFYSSSAIVIVALLYLLTWFWPPDSPWSPWWRTDVAAARAACKLAKITKRDVVYELGSGEGEFLFIAAREFGASTFGIEIDPTRYMLSVIKQKLRRVPNNQMRLIKSDFHKINISEANVVFVYLVPRALEKLLPKFKKELKKGSRIISYRYKMDLHLIAEDKTHKLYLYKIT